MCVLWQNLSTIIVDWQILNGQVENAEVRKPKYGNRSMETKVRKWEEKPPLGVKSLIDSR